MGPSGTVSANPGYDKPTFSWSPVTGAAFYGIYVTDVTTKTTVVVANVANLSTTTYTPATALTPGHTYTWYDAAVSTNGSVISYDVTTPETLTLAALAAPVPSAPLSGTIHPAPGYDTPTFSWGTVTGAATYGIIIQDVTTPKSPTTVDFTTALLTPTFTPATALTPGHTYTWYDAAVSTNGQGVTYDLASVQTITIGALTAPTAIAPLSGTTISAAAGYDMPTFSWNSVPGTTRYALYVLDTTANTVLINTTVVGNSYVATAGLTPGDSFSWYIGAVGTNGSGTVFNATPQNFTLAALAAPVPVNPLSGTVLAATGYDQPTFSWQAVTGANHYSIVVSDTTSGALIAYANVAGTTFTPATVMTPGDTFVWYVGAVGANGMGIDYDVAAAPTFTLAPLAAPCAIGPDYWPDPGHCGLRSAHL